MELVRDVFEALNQVRKERIPAVLATVVEAVGSAPQQAGARLLLLSDGQVAGTVGGGAIEKLVLEEARALLLAGGSAGALGGASGGASGGPRTRLLTVNLTTELGMCCGGTMAVFLETVPLPARLVVLGGGHIAKPLTALAAATGFAVTVVDERPQWADPARFPGARDVLCDDPESVVGELSLDAGTAVVVVTHHHPLDQALVKALTGSRAGFFGLVGSESKRNKFLMRLRAQGIAEEALARLRSPLGVAIGAVTPEEIAVSIVAELVAWRHGVALDEGVPVRAKRRREPVERS